MQSGFLPRPRWEGAYPRHRTTIAGRTVRRMARDEPNHIPPRPAQPAPTPLHTLPRAHTRQAPRPRMRQPIRNQMRAPLPQGDGAGVDIAGGLRHGRDGVRGQYVDDGSGIGSHHPGVERLPAAIVRFRRLRAIVYTPLYVLIEPYIPSDSL